MTSRPASQAERDAVVRCITLAFATDPVWELALRRADGRTDHHRPYWALFVDGAMRYGTVRVTDSLEAVSVWLPPGGTELSDEGAAELEALLAAALPTELVADIHVLYERFEASRAALADHYYLSLLATDPAHRGRGIGQMLLAADLAVWDAEGVPAYLESTNSGNDHRYARAGFRPIGGFSAVRDDTWITAMWRAVGGHTDASPG
jgi:GNAT superfamily N-acetyltransferase